MKRSQALAVSVFALLLLAALPVHYSLASGGYSEKLNVFIAGSSAYWYFTFIGVNGTNHLTNFESSPGLSWYNVTAIKTTGWLSDFQIFGREGYNLLPVPSTPSQGLFLTLGSDSYADALLAANRLDPYFTATFVSLSNGSGSFGFYSPLSFTEIMPSTLLTLVPSSMGGFASVITASSLDGTLSPFVTLSGTSGSTGFSHSLVVGSIAKKALDSSNRPNFLNYFGENITSLSAAKHSSSSIIQIHVLDGLVTSKDIATVTDDTTHFSGSYTLTLAPSAKVHVINATVLQEPLQLLAVRNIDIGVLRDGQNMSVTISLTNLSNKTALDNVTFSDDWWNPSLFRLVRDSATYSLRALNASETVTPTYVLQYIGNITGRVTIPSTAVQFGYEVGGSTFKGRARLNTISVSVGSDDAVVYAYVTPQGNLSQPLGVTQALSLVLKNVGSRTASSVVADGKQISGLLAGSSKTISIPQAATSLLDTNVTEAYPVTYFGVQGKQLNVTSNLVPLQFIHAGMKLGFATVVVGANLAPLKVGSNAISLTLTLTVTDAGSINISRFIAQVTIPKGLGCGKTTGTGISCASDIVTLNYTTLTTQSAETTQIEFNVTNPQNYFIPALSFHGTTAGIGFTGNSNAFAVPTGFILTKQFSPSLLFSGMSSTVTLTAVNKGPYYIYNASVDSTVDTFDSLTRHVVTSIGNDSISPQRNLTDTYTVIATSYYGNHTATPVTSSVFFGGTKFSLEGLGGYVSVYQPLNVTITSTPSVPTEGKNFQLSLTIRNPTTVDVSSVLLTIRVPSGMSISGLTNAMLSNGILTMATSTMLPHSNYTASGVAVVGSGTTVTFSNAHLTFVYGGVEVNGTAASSFSTGITIKENLTSRYLIPIAVALVALVAAAFYVRRLATPTVQASQK